MQDKTNDIEKFPYEYKSTKGSHHPSNKKPINYDIPDGYEYRCVEKNAKAMMKLFPIANSNVNKTNLENSSDTSEQSFCSLF